MQTFRPTTVAQLTPGADPHVVETLLRHRPNPLDVLARCERDGLVVPKKDAALYVLEVQGARFIVGEVDGAVARPLQQGVPTALALGPIPAVAPDDHGLLRLIAAEAAAAKPESEWHNGGTSRLYRMSDAKLAGRAAQTLGEVPVRLLARAAGEGPSLAAVLPLSDPGLRVLPVHRGLKDWPTFREDRFLAVVKDYARIYDLEHRLTDPVGLAEAQERLQGLAPMNHAVLLVLRNGSGKILRFRQALELEHIPAVPRNPTLRSLDLVLLEALVLRTALGVRSPEEADHAHVVCERSLEQLVDRVVRGELDVGFGLNAPPLWQLRAVIEADQTLPPNTCELLPAPPPMVLHQRALH